MEKIGIEQCHQILLDIGKTFHSLCVEYGIPYYMIGGTMLGAVRHGGFIPWDDDMDMGIPREHFDRFIQVFSEHLPAPYRLVHAGNTKYPLCFAEIEDTRTVLDDPIKARNKDAGIGIYIDIFPLDPCSDRYPAFSDWMEVKTRIDRLTRAIYFESLHRTAGKEALRKLIRLFYWRTGRRKHLIERQYAGVEQAVGRSGKGGHINLYGLYGERELVLDTVWGEPKLYPFADTQFFGVADADAFLKRIYGDYMKLPPVEKRHFHGDNYYFKGI